MTENDQLDFWTQLLHLEGLRVAHVLPTELLNRRKPIFIAQG
jgi:hypothetical protein